MYLSKVLKFPQDKCVYLLGEKGLEEELDSVGIKHKGGTDPADNVVLTSPPDFSSFEKDPSVGAVLCSMDFGISECAPTPCELGGASASTFAAGAPLTGTQSGHML